MECRIQFSEEKKKKKKKKKKNTKKSFQNGVWWFILPSKLSVKELCCEQDCFKLVFNR